MAPRRTPTTSNPPRRFCIKAVEIQPSAGKFLNGKTVSCTLITKSGGMDTLRSKLEAPFTAFTSSITKPIAQIEISDTTSLDVNISIRQHSWWRLGKRSHLSTTVRYDDLLRRFNAAIRSAPDDHNPNITLQLTIGIATLQTGFLYNPPPTLLCLPRNDKIDFHVAMTHNAILL
ncbi:hypothetical protein C8J57DRAFT_1286447 [Mycena rebaudengoi]|nr:hypothetical protein C8J57DRAFT_1286447 [Mycena rebaudengoi]